MRAALDRVAGILSNGCQDAASLNWAAVQFQHVAAVRAALNERYAPSTVNKHLSAIRGVLKAAFKLGQMSSGDYMRATDVDSVRGSTEPAGRMLEPDEVSALLQACGDDPTPAGARDAAMVALWSVTGLRRSELAALQVENYTPTTGAVRVVDGKGKKDRTVFIDNGAQRAMEDWLAVRGDEPGALFIPVHQTGQMRVDQMTPQAVYAILKKRAKQAGVTNVSPHDLRRTAISNLIEATDLSTAQKIAGHSDPKTTALYDRRDEKAKRAAAAKMSIDYRGRR
jgi:integrase